MQTERLATQNTDTNTHIWSERERENSDHIDSVSLKCQPLKSGFRLVELADILKTAKFILNSNHQVDRLFEVGKEVVDGEGEEEEGDDDLRGRERRWGGGEGNIFKKKMCELIFLIIQSPF